MTTNPYMQAVSASLRSVAWVNIHNANTGPASLILNGLLELVECPRVQSATLAFAKTTTLADALEALKDNGQAVFSCEIDKLLADSVVDLFLVASLPTGKPFECPATRFACALAAGVCLRLQRRSDVGTSLAVVGEVLPLKLVSCGIGGNMPKPQVHTERFADLFIGRRVGGLFFYLNIKVVTILSSALECGTGGLLTGQSGPLEVAQFERKDAATVQQPQTDGLALHVELKNASVIVDTGRFKLTVPRFLVGQARSYSSDGTNREISRQAKLLAHGMVTALVQIVLAMTLVLIAPICHKIAGRGKRFHRRVYTRGHRRRNYELTRECANRFHAYKHSELFFIMKGLSFKDTQGSQRLVRWPPVVSFAAIPLPPRFPSSAWATQDGGFSRPIL